MNVRSSKTSIQSATILSIPAFVFTATRRQVFAGISLTLVSAFGPRRWCVHVSVFSSVFSSFLTVGQAQGHTDENTPPTSKFFDANQRIKAVTPPAVAAPPIVATPAAPPPPAVGAAGLSLSDLLLATILSQGGGGGGPLAALLPQLHPAPVAPPPPPPPPLQQSAPPSPVKPHSVSIADFAKTYNLADGDVELLTQVGFRPGDATEASLHEDLKSAGFTFFSWRRIHTANVRFKADLARGTYD